MSSIKNEVLEMVSTFETKCNNMSTEQLQQQTHHCWPVCNSSNFYKQLKKSLMDEMEQSLELVIIAIKVIFIAADINS